MERISQELENFTFLAIIFILKLDFSLVSLNCLFTFPVQYRVSGSFEINNPILNILYILFWWQNILTSWGWAVPSSGPTSCQVLLLSFYFPVRSSLYQVVFLSGRLPVRSSPCHVVFLLGFLPGRLYSCQIVFLSSCLPLRLSYCHAFFLTDRLPFRSSSS